MEKDELPWSAERQLSWEDFRGVPPENPGEEAAHIYLTISFTWRGAAWFDQAHGKWKARPIEIITNNTMNRRGSWVLPEHKTRELLHHEQKHFDLHEVYRRLLDMTFQRALKTLEGQGRSAEEALRNLGKSSLQYSKEYVEKPKKCRPNTIGERNTAGTLRNNECGTKKISRWLEDPTKVLWP